MVVHLDDFNSGASSSLSSSWSTGGGYAVSSDGYAYTIDTRNPAAIFLPAPAGADQFVERKFANNTGVSMGVLTRASLSGNSVTRGYLARHNGSSIAIFKAVGGSFSQLGQASHARAAGQTMRLESIGNQHTVFVDDVQIVAVSDSSYLSGGSVGMRDGGTADSRIDSMRGGDYSAAQVSTTSGTASATAFASSLSGPPTKAASANAVALATSSGSSTPRRTSLGAVPAVATATATTYFSRYSLATALSRVSATAVGATERQASGPPASLSLRALGSSVPRRVASGLAIGLARAFGTTGASETHVSVGVALASALAIAQNSARRTVRASARSRVVAESTETTTRTRREEVLLLARARGAHLVERFGAETALARALAEAVTVNPSNYHDVDLQVGAPEGHFLSIREPEGHPLLVSEVAP